MKLLSPFSSLLRVKFKVRLNARILRLNFLRNLAKGAKAPSPWLRHWLRPQNLKCALYIKTTDLWKVFLRIDSCHNHQLSTVNDQARSQDLENGGAFLKERKKCKWPWPKFSLFLNQNHTVCPEIETEFLGKLGNSNVFSAQHQLISKKKKIFTETETDFSAETGNSNGFSAHKQGTSPTPPPWLRYC